MSEKHEANIQCELYIALKSCGFNVEAEYDTPVGRLDLVVWSGPSEEEIKCAIEIKRGIGGYSSGSRQRFRYERLGIPVIVCRGMTGIDGAVEQVKAIGSSVSAVVIQALERNKRRGRCSKAERVQKFVDRIDLDVNFRR